MPLTDALFLDPFPFHKWIARRSDGQAGTGTHSDPLSANTPERFDELLNSFDPLTVVHLGPGTFYTRGYYDGGASSGYGWQVKQKMCIAGSGVDLTTLQLVVNAPAPGSGHFYAIGHPLTIDPDSTPNLADFLCIWLSLEGNVFGSIECERLWEILPRT